jgi:hypothetical protein
MKVWSSKYALSRGITQEEAQETSCRGLLRIGPSAYLNGEGGEWHHTYEEAVAKGEEMRQEKLLVTRRRMDRLERLRFPPTPPEKARRDAEPSDSNTD